MNKTFSGENVIGNPSKRRYGDIDTDYDKWCEDGGKRRATPTLEQKIMLKKREVKKWVRYTPAAPHISDKVIARRKQYKESQLRKAHGELKQLEYELSQRLTPDQLFHMLQTTGVSLPKRSQYEAILKPALEFGLIECNKHNHYSMAKPKLPFAIGDKVRVKNTSRNAFMQTIYTVCKPIKQNGTVWYPLVQDYRKGMIYRKADMLEVS